MPSYKLIRHSVILCREGCQYGADEAERVGAIARLKVLAEQDSEYYEDSVERLSDSNLTDIITRNGPGQIESRIAEAFCYRTIITIL